MKPNITITRTADGKESRSFAGVQLRAENAFAITGIAAAYNVKSSDLGGFREIIAPGAFTDSLRADDQVCFFNHNPDQILGRKKSGTLTITDTDAGLSFRCMLDRSNPTHQSVYASIQRGDVEGCSFSFSILPDGDEWAEEQSSKTVVRTLRKVKLFELGPVVFPAYPQGTSVGARAEQRSNYVLGTDNAWRERAITALKKYFAEMDGQ